MNFNRKKTTLFIKQARLFVAVIVSIVTTSVLADSDGHILKGSNESSQNVPQKASLYTRLGGYDAIAAVVNETMPHLMADPNLGRFWANRGADGIKREKQLLIDFIVNQAGGPVNYGGRDMATTHKGMKISDDDWKVFMGHLNNTLEKFKVPSQEKTDVVAFMESLRETTVE